MVLADVHDIRNADTHKLNRFQRILMPDTQES